MRVLCFSSFNYAYLDRALVLYESLRQWQPDWHTVALLTDSKNSDIPIDEALVDEVVFSSDLPIDNFSQWIFRHNVIEACTAVKGIFIDMVCNRGDYDAIVFLDPDTCLFAPLNIEDMLKDNDIVLTPHQLMPDETSSAIWDNEVTSLATGIYNLGFFAISTSGEGARFAKWWNRRLREFCYDDIASGLFVDQKWCDHVPSFFERVRILKDPGYNVASWNLSHRRVAIGEDGTITINNVPLRFWHFTKLGPVGDQMTKRYAGSNFEVFEIWAWYRRAVSRFRPTGQVDTRWAFDFFEDGEKIEAEARHSYRRSQQLQSKFPNPFQSGPGSFQEHFRRSEH